MRRAIALALALLPAIAGAQLVRVPPVRTVATLGACTDGSPKIVAVTDGATASDCASGAGTYDVTCYCANGAWAAAASASGTVTTFSVVTANGVSASVANATTTPAATFTLGAITPSSVAAVGTIGGSNFSGSSSGTNTGDQTNISGNAATATALQATLGVAGGGTGATSLTAYAPVCGGTTSTGAVQSCGTGIGTTGYVLTSNGSSALPSWQAASGGGIGGSTGPADNALLCSDGSAGATAQACNAASHLLGPSLAVYPVYTDAMNYEGISLSGGSPGYTVRLAAESAGSGADNLDIVLDPLGTGGVEIGAEMSGAATQALFSVMYLGGNVPIMSVGTAASIDGIGLGYLSYPEASVVVRVSADAGSTTQLVQIDGDSGSTSAGGDYPLVIVAADDQALALTEWRASGGGVLCRVGATGWTQCAPLASPPVTCGDAGTEGVEYNDTSHAKCWCSGSAWVVVAGAGSCS